MVTTQNTPVFKHIIKRNCIGWSNAWPSQWSTKTSATKNTTGFPYVAFENFSDVKTEATLFVWLVHNYVPHTYTNFCGMHTSSNVIHKFTKFTVLPSKISTHIVLVIQYIHEQLYWWRHNVPLLLAIADYPKMLQPKTNMCTIFLCILEYWLKTQSHDLLTLLKLAAALRADWEYLTFSVTVTTYKNTVCIMSQVSGSKING